MARHALIACSVFRREFEAVRLESPHELSIRYLDQGLHDRGGKFMTGVLQEAVRKAEEDGADVVLLGYALCNNGIVGLQARRAALVVPRAHDCITLFLGSKERFAREFKSTPGRYYLTSGWIENATRPMESLPTRQDANGVVADPDIYNRYVEQFGEDNARYLMETMHGWRSHYRQVALIDMGVGDREAYRKEAETRARERGLKFAELSGDLRLFRGMVSGPPWAQDDFLVLQPGEQIKPSYDESILTADKEIQES